jgi:predicted lipoprotein with Yx(FWY)xxD motif
MRAILAASAVMLSLSALAETGPAGVTFQQRGHGWLLHDAKGMSLYTFVRDVEPGKSNCNGPCVEQWPPLVASEGDHSNGDWTVLVREDGSRQWAYRGKPLYAYARDVSPGDSYGDGVNEQWFSALKPIATPAGASVAKTLLGHVIADRKGMTLYANPKAAACVADCALTFTPVAASWMAKGEGDWSVVTRADGSKQWAFRGQALYRYSGDVKPRETSGHGKSGFAAIMLEPPPPRPAWVTVLGGDAGPILGDANKKTLYARIPPRPARQRPTQLAQAGGVPQAIELVGQTIAQAPESDKEKLCGIECPDSVWRPLIAAAGDKPIGNWSIIKREDGRMQWAYKGNTLYTNIRDVMPGDLEGIRSGEGRDMRTLTPTGEQMPGTGA